MAVNYNVWQNDYSHKITHRNIFNFNIDGKHFFTSRNAKHHLERRDFIRNFYVRRSTANRVI